MGIFKTSVDTIKNHSRFKEWEEKQNDIEAQRDELNKTREYTPQKLTKAKMCGKEIMDVIDIMDSHSEDYAEDVETATQPIVALSSFVSVCGALFLSLLKTHTIIKDYSMWSKNFIKEYNLENIANIFTKNKDITIGEKECFVKSSTLLSERFLKRANIKEITVNDQKINKSTLLEYAKKYGIEQNNYFKRIFKITGIAAALGIAGAIAINALATKFQITGSRIGRHNAREKLNNEKYFVQYTDEQIQQAEENLMKKTKEKGGFFHRKKKNKTDGRGFWGNFFHSFSDYKKYKEWEKTDKHNLKLIDRPLNNQELIEAEKDKEVIQRITRKINNKAEEYSENMETAATAIIFNSVLLGGVVASATTWILNKIGISEKFLRNNVSKYLDSDGMKEFNEVMQVQKGPKLKTSAEKLAYSKKLKNVMTNISLGIEKSDASLFKKFKLFGYAFTIPKKSRLWVVGAIGGFLAMIPTSLMVLKLQKNASRAGRYIAKRELEENPENFIGLTEEELKTVKHIKAKNDSIGKRLKNYVLFVPTAVKQYFEYSKYKKTKLQHDKDLKEELIQLKDISNTQLKDAKNLQRKLFNTFEKLDDKSQEYSETAEFVNDMGTQLVQYGSYAGFLGVPIFLIVQIGRGKITVGKLIEWFLSISSHSSSLSKGFLKRHVKQSGENLTKIVNDVQMDEKKISDILKKLDQNYEKIKNCNSTKDIKEILGNLNMPKTQIDEIVSQIELFGGIKHFREIVNFYSNGSKGQLTAFMNSQGIKDMSSLKEFFSKEKFRKILNTFKQRTNTQAIPENFAELLKDPSIKKIAEAIDEKTYAKLDDGLNNIFYRNITIFDKGQLNKKDLLASITKIEKLISNMPKEELSELTKTIFRLIQEKPDEVLYLIKNNPEKFISAFTSTPIVKQTMLTLGISFAVMNLLLSYILCSILAKFEKEAGRYGVMKSLEELQDNRYYANIEPNLNNQEITKSNT